MKSIFVSIRKACWAFGVLMFAASNAFADELNILLIGTSRSFSDGGEFGVVHQKPYNPASIATHLQSILSQDPQTTVDTPTVNVVFEDNYKTKTQNIYYTGSQVRSFTSHCYSLPQNYFWTDGRAARLANWRGEGDHQWDYIILCHDPYILANFPGMVAEGVRMVREEVAKSANPAQIVLLAQWPENSSTFTVAHFNEVIQRVGSSAGLPVVPAGRVWEAYGSQDTHANHPTPRGAYLAAASLFSELTGRSASTSNFTFSPDGNAMADHAHTVVQAEAGQEQYSGIYTAINPFQMKQVPKRAISVRHTGTSTERRIRDALTRVAVPHRISFTNNAYAGASGDRWDFNYGRGNDWWEEDKQYEVNPATKPPGKWLASPPGCRDSVSCHPPLRKPRFPRPTRKP